MYLYIYIYIQMHLHIYIFIYLKYILVFRIASLVATAQENLQRVRLRNIPMTAKPQEWQRQQVVIAR